MSLNDIHGDSLLSSISNISVKIDHTEIDDPGFFHHNMHRSFEDNQADGEVDIGVLDDDEDIDHASLVKQIYFRCKAHHNGTQQNEQGFPWVTKKEIHGMSEQENDSQHNESSIKHQSQKELRQIENQSEITLSAQYLKKHRLQRLQQEKRMKNETKNIPKNYGKAIITFIQKYEQKVRAVLQLNALDFADFIYQLKQKKKVINTIADLRSMWLDYKYAREMRLLSNLFLRKYSLSYIFNSRICNYTSHIKYRYRLGEAIKEPFLFKHIKDY